LKAILVDFPLPLLEAYTREAKVLGVARNELIRRVLITHAKREWLVDLDERPVMTPAMTPQAGAVLTRAELERELAELEAEARRRGLCL
jgi:hypothetical protein